jgi:two-component system, cell cycle sensor histidine kinase and response regulator CckA
VIAGKVREALGRSPRDRALTGFAVRGERYRRMVELAPHGIALLDLDGVVLDVNPAIERLLGRDRDEIVGRSCTPFTHPEDHERELPLLEATLDGRREGYALDKRYLRKDGSAIWARLSITLIRDERGRPSHLLALIEDVDDRYQLDLALRESESRYRSVFHESGSGIVLLTPAGDVVQANAAFAEMLGSTRQGVKGRTFEELVAFGDGSHERNGRELRNECRLERADGRAILVDVRLTAIPDGEGGVRYLLAILDDVTEKRRLADELRRSRDDLKLALDGAEAGIWTWTVATGEVRWSENLERIHGMEPGGFGGTVDDVLKEVYPDDLERVSEAIRRTLEEHDDYRIEYRIVRPDGELAWVEAVGRIERDGEGELQLTGVCMDVTERHRLEEDRRSTHELLENLIATSPLGIVSLDRDGRVLLWNEACEAMYGWSAGEAIGRPLPTVPPDDWAELVRDLEEQFADRSHHRGTEIVRRRRDGTPITIALWTSTLRDAEGEVVANVSLQADTSERKLLETQLEEAARLEAVGKLAGGVAHDFNNLLTVIGGHADILLRSQDLPPHAQRELLQVRLAAERAADVVRQLLAFSRRQMLEPALVDLNDVVAEVASMLRHLIGEDVLLRVEPAAEPVCVVADRAQLGQVLVNLAVNARDAMPAGGELSIASDRVELGEPEAAATGCAPGRYARIRVRDTGTGMDDETRTRAFEPFFTTKAPGEGTGLGLATSYGVVTQSGGAITVESVLGTGTTVTILLREHDGEPTVPAGRDRAQAAAPGGVAGLTVLVVEDEPLLRELLVEMLRSVSANVLEADGAGEAIARADGHGGPIDALVTDLVMPGTSGRELAQAVTERHPGLRVLYISGYSDAEIAARGILAPEMSFLQKPFTVDELESKLCELLEAS